MMGKTPEEKICRPVGDCITRDPTSMSFEFNPENLHNSGIRKKRTWRSLQKSLHLGKAF